MIKRFKIKKFRRINTGFTLVETLVAISIFTMSILGLMSILASGISDTTYAKQKMVASYLAQEGIEYVRNMRDTAVLYPVSPDTSQTMWDKFRTGLVDISSPPAYSNPSFIRTVYIQPVAGITDEVKITSTVTWTQGSGPQTVTFSENLFNWVQ